MNLRENVALIDAARDAQGWSHVELAARAGWSVRTWERLRAGSTNVTIAAILDFGQAVGMRDMYLEW